MTRRRAKRQRLQQGGNYQFNTVTVRRIVVDPQFRSGYLDRLADRPPRRFFYDEAARGAEWSYERGRLVATWLVATGQEPPASHDIRRLVAAYCAAEAADAVL